MPISEADMKPRVPGSGVNSSSVTAPWMEVLTHRVANRRRLQAERWIENLVINSSDAPVIITRKRAESGSRIVRAEQDDGAGVVCRQRAGIAHHSEAFPKRRGALELTLMLRSRPVKSMLEPVPVERCSPG